MIRRAALAATVLFVLSSASVSAAGTTTVQTSTAPLAFNPKTVQIGLGSSVNWQNNSISTNHTSTSDIPGIWDVTVDHGTTSFVVDFASAGSYLYHCRIHATMHGTVNVRMAAAPSSATLGQIFDIRWSMDTAPAGWVFDIQRKKPNKPFKNWLTGVTVDHVNFQPARKGTFQFRSRLRKLGGKSTGYSPNISITVT